LPTAATPGTEATVQADVRRLLIEAPLGLDEDQVVVLEAPVEGRRRIGVEVGYTVIEVKKDLRLGRVRADAEAQLAGYVQARTLELGQRYVGVLTEGGSGAPTTCATARWSRWPRCWCPPRSRTSTSCW
jgi:hypothetical protein